MSASPDKVRAVFTVTCMESGLISVANETTGVPLSYVEALPIIQAFGEWIGGGE